MVVTNKTDTGIISGSYAPQNIPAKSSGNEELKEKLVSNSNTGEVVLNLSYEGKLLAQKELADTTATRSAKLNATQQKMIENLKNDTSLGLSKQKKNAMVMAAERIFQEGYEVKFVAGLLGNIQNEGAAGKFESSAYISHPEQEPAYLKYMDEHFNYRKEFSGKSISDVGITKAIELQEKAKKSGFKGKFGLGMIQWTGGRTSGLLDSYKKYCKSDKPTAAECAKAEENYMVDELKGEYASVYKEWKNSKDKSAENAGSIICKKYEVPADTENQAKLRAKNALRIYNVMKK